ncbi:MULTISPECIES: calcium-binding protein [unclassified Microcoleus]|uniref:calcium-binding protein n=1 Tax=unclassified Microcoleus TaxID=2642155 RepID=UPI002FD5B3BD
MSSVIKGTDFNDNNTVNGDGKLHKSLVGDDWTIDGQGQIQISNDTIYGYKGDDILSGRGGDDILYGGFGGDKLDGGAGNDKLYGEAGEDFLYGGGGKDTLSGGLHNDYLFGGSGKDYLIGGDGNDYLDGANFSGAGNGIGGGTESDSLAGGTGADTFVLGNVDNVYYLGTGYATITDFTLGTDKIQIKGNLADGYSLKAGDWNGNNVQDTGIFYKDNLIGVVRDKNLTNVNQNQVFLSAPPIPQ